MKVFASLSLALTVAWAVAVHAGPIATADSAVGALVPARSAETSDLATETLPSATIVVAPAPPVSVAELRAADAAVAPLIGTRSDEREMGSRLYDLAPLTVPDNQKLDTAR